MRESGGGENEGVGARGDLPAAADQLGCMVTQIR
jgi:hypothetical protein